MFFVFIYRNYTTTSTFFFISILETAKYIYIYISKKSSFYFPFFLVKEKHQSYILSLAASFFVFF